MKNILLGAIGILTTIYVTLIGMNLYMIQTHKDQLENCFSRILQQALVDGYNTADDEEIAQRIISELAESRNKDSAVQVVIQAMDLKRGFLSVKVTERFSLLTGKEKEITLEKIILMDRIVLNEDQVKVTFLLEGEVFKSYQLIKGENCPLPKSPEGNFAGWVKQGDDTKTLISSIGEVWEDEVYIAVMK